MANVMSQSASKRFTYEMCDFTGERRVKSDPLKRERGRKSAVDWTAAMLFGSSWSARAVV